MGLLFPAGRSDWVATREAFRVRWAGPGLAGEQAVSDAGASGLAACAYDLEGDEEGDGLICQALERLSPPWRVGCLRRATRVQSSSDDESAPSRRSRSLPESSR